MLSKGSKPLLILNFAIVYFVWGMTFIWMKVATQELHPFIIIFWQNIIAAVILVALNGPSKFLSFFKKHYFSIITQSFFMLICGVSFITISVDKLPASFAAIIISSVPIWVAVFNGLSVKSVSPKRLAGILLGFLGLVFLLQSESQFIFDSYLHLAMLVLASLSWSYGLFRMNKLAIIHDPYLSSASQMLVAALFYLILIALFIPEPNFLSSNIQTLGSIASLAILGSTIAFSSFNWLLKHSSPVKVSTYAYINPLVSIFMAWILLGEKLKLNQIPYIAIILISVFMVVGETTQEPK